VRRHPSESALHDTTAGKRGVTWKADVNRYVSSWRDGPHARSAPAASIAFSMKTSIQLIEQIIRAKTALHLKLIAHRNGGKVDIGGVEIDDLLAEVDTGLSRYERMLVRFKNEIAAKVMESADTE
jgi:hypothetical protein